MNEIKSLLKSWPHKWYGYWDWNPDSNISTKQFKKYGIYKIEPFIDNDWKIPDLNAILEYLQKGTVFFQSEVEMYVRFAENARMKFNTLLTAVGHGILVLSTTLKNTR